MDTNTNKMKQRIRIKKVLLESQVPDSDYTEWTSSDIDMFENRGYEYNDGDDSYSMHFYRGEFVVLVQKPREFSYMVKVLHYLNANMMGKVKIVFDEVVTSPMRLQSVLSRAEEIANNG